MDDNTKKIVKWVGCVVLAYLVITTRVISIAETEGHNSRIVVGTNFWRFYPVDSVANYCDRNAGGDMSIGLECVEQISKKIAADKWLITLTESDKPNWKF